MKKLLFLLILLASPAVAQNGARFGDQAPVQSVQTPGGTVFSVPNAAINFCNFPANGVPCTNKAVTYTDITLATPCPSNQQVTLVGSTSCVTRSDQYGNWGVNIAAGNYAYTVTLPSGASVGPYVVTIGVGGGGGGSGAFNSLTSGTNSQAAMVVGTGSSMSASGSGTIDATGAPFSGLTSGVNTIGSLVVGNGAILDFTGTGSINASKITGTSVPANSAADQFLGTTASATGQWAAMPSCLDSGGQHLNYNTSTHAFACGTSGGTAGSAAFNSITNGTNSQAAMVVDTGASLSATGSGTITATAAPFSGISNGTNTTATMTVGTGGTINLSGSGHVDADTINQTTVPVNSAADETIVTTASATGSWAALPACLDAGGNHLNYNTTTHLFSCGTSGGTAGSAAFNTITDGTNSSAAMVVGTGSSLAASGTGTIAATSSPFAGLTTGSNTSATMTVGTGGSITFSGSGTVNSSQINGTSVPANVASDTVLGTTASATGSWLTLPPCLDSGGNHLNYNTTTHGFFCGTSSSGGGGGAAGFNSITTGVNNTANMVVGTGASMTPSGTGTIVATGASVTPTQCAAGQAAAGVDTSFNAAGCFNPAGAPGGVNNDVQVKVGTSTFGSGVTNTANVGTVGNISVKVNSSNAIQYVSSHGNDSNDGRSEGTAKLSVYAALEALPGGATSPPTAGNGTVQVFTDGGSNCALWNPFTSPPVGIGFMVTSDPNYASPPNGWMHFAGNKGNGTIAIIGVTQASQTSLLTGAGKSCLTVTGTVPTTEFIPNGGGITLNNIQFGSVQPMALGYDSTGANISGSVGNHFINDAIAVSTNNGTGGPTVKIGQNVFQNYWDNDTLSTDCGATPGSDAGANVLIRAGLGNTQSFAQVFTNNWWYCGGGIKYYVENGFATITVNRLDIEASGTNVNPAVWFTGSGGRCLDCEITGVELQDYFGTNAIPGVRNDSVDNIVVAGIGGYQPGNCVSCDYGTTQGPMTVSGVYNTFHDLSSPLRKGQTGFLQGRVFGLREDATRQFGPAGIRFTNIARTDPSTWGTSGSVTLTTSGITAPDGTTNAGRGISTSGSQFIYLLPQASQTLAVGDWLVAKVAVHSYTNNGYQASNPILIVLNNGGTITASCANFGPPNAGDGQWDIVGEACKITGVNSPSFSYIALYASVDTTHGLDAYAPVLNYIPSGTISDNEIYSYFYSMNLYANTCAVGTVCGIQGVAGGSVNINSANVSNPNFNSGTPAAPAGNQNLIYQASGSNVSGYVPLPITVNGGSGLPSANLQNGSANLGDTINMVQSSSNVSAQIAAGSIRTATGGGTGVSNPTAHGVAVAEGSSAFTFPVGSVDGQCLLWHAADPAFGTCPSGFTNPMSIAGQMIYSGAGGTANALSGPTSPNGVPQQLISIPTGGSAGTPQWQVAGVPVNAQSGSGYTLVATDRAAAITLSNASPQNLNLVDPSTSGFNANYTFIAKNIGTGAWTAVCTTFLCNGAASLLIPPNWSALVWSNNVTYTVSRFPNFDAFTNTGTNAAMTYNSTTGAFGSLTIGPGSSTNGDLASFNGTGGLPIQDAGIAAANVTQNSVSGTTNALPKFSAAHTITNSTLQDDGSKVKLTTENFSLAGDTLVEEIANEGVTGTTNVKLAKFTGAPSSLIITTAGDTKFEGICIGNCGTTGNAQIAVSGQASCTFDGATTAGDYVQQSASVNGDCTDAGATRPTSGQIVGKVTSTNGGGGVYSVELYGLDDIAVNPTGGSGPALKTNGSSNADQTALNLQNSAATNGVTLTVTNTGTSNVQLGITGTLNNAGLTNAATTVNGVTCTLGATCNTAPTLVQKVSSGAGNYTTSSTSFVAVDNTNLSYTVTIPTGSKLSVIASGSIGNTTNGVFTIVALGSGTCSTLLEQVATNATNDTTNTPFALNWIVNGDGASHTILLCMATTSGGGAIVSNGGGASVVVMDFRLEVAN